MLCHFEGHDSADTETCQAVGSTRLQLADLPNEIFGDCLDLIQGPAAVKTNWLEHMYRLVSAQNPGKVRILKRIGLRCGDHKERRPEASWLEGYDGRSWRRWALTEEGGHLLNGRCPKHCRDRQALAKGFVDLS